MLAIPPCGASSNIALWRAKIKPPVELVVGDLKNNTDIFRAAALFKKRFDPFWDSEMRAGTAKHRRHGRILYMAAEKTGF